jgi:hypothetical protein
MMKTFESKTARFTFTTYLAAAEALLVVMMHARTTKQKYRITGRSPERILTLGLLLEGEIDEVSELVADTPGATLRDS